MVRLRRLELPRGISPTATSTLRVYQFRHSRTKVFSHALAKWGDEGWSPANKKDGGMTVLVIKMSHKYLQAFIRPVGKKDSQERLLCY